MNYGKEAKEQVKKYWKWVLAYGFFLGCCWYFGPTVHEHLIKGNEGIATIVIHLIGPIVAFVWVTTKDQGVV